MNHSRFCDLVSTTGLLDEYSVAQLYRVSVATLRRWRARKMGPVFCKVGARLIRYRPADVEAYLASRTRPKTTDEEQEEAR